ncbi:MAG TPA: type II secretion system protein GspF, partial [Colwellia sp.]|nr:type II secretion system protein GspF [Colwellia sp.]
GKTKKGVIEGDTARQVRGLLRDQGLMPTEVTATLTNKKAADKPSSSSSFRQSGSGKVSPSELALITRQLATLVESGLP